MAQGVEARQRPSARILGLPPSLGQVERVERVEAVEEYVQATV
jgi:hypothetical protein